MSDIPYARCYNVVLDPETIRQLLAAPPKLPPDWFHIDLNTLPDGDPLLTAICFVLRAMAEGLIPTTTPEGGL